MSDENNVVDGSALVNSQESAPEPLADTMTGEEVDSICDDMALRIAIGLRQITESGDQVVFMLLNPRFIENVRARLFAMTDEAFPQVFRDNITLVEDPNVEKVSFVTVGNLEEQFLKGHFTENGFLPRLEQFMSQSRLNASVGGQMHTLPIPVRLGIDTLRTLYFMEMRDRFAPQIVVPPMGARIDRGLRG